jgi:tetratricopeptide (TPR) repeat protein
MRPLGPYANLLAIALAIALTTSAESSDLPENPESTWSYHQVGCIDSIHRDSDSSQMLCEKSLQFALREGTEARILEALDNLATAHSRAGRKADALGVYLRKIDRLRKLNDEVRKDDMARTLMVAAGISEELGDLGAALLLLDEASKIGKGGAFQGDISAAMAGYWERQGKLKKAEQNYLQAVELCGAEIGCKVSVLIRYARMLKAADRYAEAERIHTRIGAYLTELEPLQLEQLDP